MGPEENTNTSPTVGANPANNFGTPEPQNISAQPIFFSSTSPSKTSAPIMGQPAVSLEPATPEPTPAEPVTPVAPAPQPIPAPAPAPEPIQPPVQPQPTLADLAAEAAYAEELKTAPDIVLAQDKKPMNKKLIIGLGAAAIIAVVAVVASLAFTSSGQGGQTGGVSGIKKTFAELYDSAQVLITTTENPASDEDQTFDEAFPEFDDKYTAFNKVAKNAKNISTNVNKLGSYIDVAKRAIFTEETTSELTEQYSQDNQSAATSFLDGIETAVSDDDPLHTVASIEYDYYSAILEQYVMYATAGCAKGYDLDYGCAVAHYGNDFELNRQGTYVGRAKASLDSAATKNIIRSGISSLLEEMKPTIEALK